ncbi:transmembrane protein 131-like [Diaphorina citri]|uniref:Transmembrane protein 131-like n=1 Tax=Diaphorina citri TaxID=121845 RepID=A0A3Q0IVU4_DIACI|nr:transmembrane protein 131-like [Diaphorina citri]
MSRDYSQSLSHTEDHTGPLILAVRGMIVENPYRVRPVLSRLPLNASFSPTISIHNPYSSPLQLVEVYKSDGEMSLELPGGGDLPAPRSSWEIAPFSSKPILRVRYNAVETKNHTSYIRVLTTWGTNLTNIALEFLGTERGNASSFLSKFHTFYNLTKSMSVLPGHYAVLRVSVFTTHLSDTTQFNTGSRGAWEGVQYGSVWLKTDYERATLSLRMNLARGGLDILPDPVYIRHCFPGKVCRETLRVASRFNIPMSVLSVSPVLHNPHFAFVKEEGATISPGSSSAIGNLTYYVPDLHYLGIHTDDRGIGGIVPVPTTEVLTVDFDPIKVPPDTAEPFHVATLTYNWAAAHRLSNTRDFDMENLKLQNVDFKHLLLKKINLTLKLETSAVSGFLFRTSVAMTRASVTRERVVHFPLTQIGNTSYRNITLVNPFERHTLKVQLVLEKHYPYSNTIISEIPDSLKPSCNFGDCHFTSPQEFGFEKIHQDSHVLSSPIHSVHKDTPFYELEPGENITVNLAFAPSLSQKSTALLFIRNDKTVLETVLLSGIGALVQFDLY